VIEVSPWVVESAFRYALGRQSYIVAATVDLLIANKDQLTPFMWERIIRDIDRAIADGLPERAAWERVQTYQGISTPVP
jgi:hypothetical protein